MLTNARTVFSITFFVVFVGLLVQLGLVFSPFLPTILWAVILARLFYPLYRKALQLTRGHEAVSAGLLTLTVMGAVVIPTIYLVVLAVQESVDAYRAVTTWAEAGGVKEVGESLSHLPVIGRVSQQLAGRVIVAQGDVELSIVGASKRLSAFLVTQVGQLAQDAFVLATDFLVMLFTLFFLFKDGHRLFARLYTAIPLEAAHKDRIFERLNGAVAAVVRGTLLTALLQGAIAGITYALLDLPYAVFLGALSALVALAPFGGTALVWAPLAVYLFATGFIMKAVVLLAVGAGLVSLMDNVFYYWITGDAARLPVLFLFFASLGGVAYYGFVGLFLGPILLAVVMAAFHIYEEDYQPSTTTRIVTPEDTRQT